LLVSSVGSSSIPAVLRGAKKLRVCSSSVALAPVVCLAAFFIFLASLSEAFFFRLLRSRNSSFEFLELEIFLRLTVSQSTSSSGYRASLWDP
jgi:hypothetical protein